MLKTSVFLCGLVLLPSLLLAQASGAVQKMHDELQKIYSDMMPMCADLIDTARGIGAFGALFYVGFRVWKHLAAAEPIDFFPLLRPFALAGLLTIYPFMLDLMRDVLSPTVAATDHIVQKTHQHLEIVLEQRKKAITDPRQYKPLWPQTADRSDWYKYEQTPGTAAPAPNLSAGQGMMFSFNIMNNAMSYGIKLLLSWILQILYYAASLTIDTLRTFQLLVLSIIGPFVLALSAFDGFGNSLLTWLTRFVNVFLWLPICNLIGAMLNKIQAKMLASDLSQIAAGGLGFDQTDLGYMLFMFIAIISYFSVPSIASYVVHASGASSVMSRVTNIITAVAVRK